MVVSERGTVVVDVKVPDFVVLCIAVDWTTVEVVVEIGVE